MNRDHLRRLALAGLFTALGVLLSGLAVPVGPTRCFPAQHALNALGGVLLGPWWAAGAAAVTSLLRVALGTGTLFAFPGSLPGALAVGFAAALLPDRLKPLGALAEPCPPAPWGPGSAPPGWAPPWASPWGTPSWREPSGPAASPGHCWGWDSWPP